MKKFFTVTLCLFIFFSGLAQKEIKLKKKDKKKDVELITNYGSMIIRLSDSTPLHRDNFLKLVKQGFYDSVLFHRVINQFMIQTGDPDSKRAQAGAPLGNGGPGYNIPAEFRATLFHKKGAVAAARQSDDVNPKKESSGSQFYIVQGRALTEANLASMESRPGGIKISPEQREVYKTIGGTPFLDKNYTVFGEVINGLDIIDKIASVETSRGMDADRPVQDVRIIKAKLIKRKKR